MRECESHFHTLVHTCCELACWPAAVCESVGKNSATPNWHDVTLIHSLLPHSPCLTCVYCSCRSSTSTSTIPSTPPAEDLAATPQLLLLCSRLLEAPPAFAVRYKPLLLRLLEPLQLNFNLLNPEQMAQVPGAFVGALIGLVVCFIVMCCWRLLALTTAQLLMSYPHTV